MVASTALVAMALALGYGLLETPVYRASATLYVTSTADSTSAQSAYQGTLSSQQRVLSYGRLVHAEAVLEGALQVSGSSLTTSELNSKVSASVDADTVLLTVSVDDSNDRLARELANGVAESLKAYVGSLEVPAGGGNALAKLTIVSPASVDAHPISPNISRYVLVAAAVGVLLGFAAVSIRFRLDSTLRSQLDVEALLERPCLAVVPRDASLSEGFLDLSHGATPAGEAFRRLRTNLGFVVLGNQSTRVVVSSSLPDEGKTTTALNLVAALAESGKQVVLVDADLRRPTVGSRLGLSSSVGLSDVLRGDVELDGAIQHSPSLGADVLLSGSLPPNPAEVLGSETFRSVLVGLSENYDHVVVDSPPILPVTDAVVAAGSGDGVLLVVREGRTTRPELLSTMHELALADVPILGFVLNGGDTQNGYGRYTYDGSSLMSVKGGD